MIRSKRWLCVLDDRTPFECGVRDLRQWTPDGQPIGHAIPLNECSCGRCLVLPVAATFRELGIDIDEPSAGERASADGPVPAEMSYAEWIEGSADKVQDRALGLIRAAFVRRGSSYAHLFAPDGSLIPLASLEANQPRLCTPPLSNDVAGVSMAVTGLTAPNEQGSREFVFSTVCTTCGGVDMIHEKERGERSLVRCAACRKPYGRWGALIAKAREIGAAWLAANR